MNKWIARGASDNAIAGITGSPRGTRPAAVGGRRILLSMPGLYLGDGCLSGGGAGLMIALDGQYPGT